MSEAHKKDKHVDRLMHVLLMEELGGKRPPDLSDAILSRARVERRRRLPRWSLYLAAAAAIVLVTTYALCWTLLNWSYPAPTMKNIAPLPGALDTQYAVGEGAELTLGNYCTIALTRGSQIRVLKKEPYDEEIYLARGEVHCQVDKSDAPAHATFAVRTDVGVVRVKGTDFIVRVIEPQGEDKMKRMFVKVMAGVVIASGAQFVDTTLKAQEQQTLPARKKVGGFLEREIRVLDLNDAQLGHALGVLTKITGVRFLYDAQEAEGKKVTIKVTDTTLRTVLDKLKQQVDMDYRGEAKGVRVTFPDSGEVDADAAIKAILEKKLTVEFVNAAVPDVIAYLRQVANVNIVYRPPQHDVPAINLSVRDMALKDLLKWITQLGGLRYEVRNGAIYILPGKSKKPAATRPKARQGKTVAKRDMIVRKKLGARKITVDYDDAPIPDVLRHLSQLTGVNIVLDAEVDAKTPITLTVTNMSVDKILQWICDLADLRYEVRNDAVYVMKKGSKAGPKTKPEGDVF